MFTSRALRRARKMLGMDNLLTGTLSGVPRFSAKVVVRTDEATYCDTLAKESEIPGNWIVSPRFASVCVSNRITGIRLRTTIASNTHP